MEKTFFFKETLARSWHLSLEEKLKRSITERAIRMAVSLDLDNSNVRSSGLLSKEQHLCLLIMKYSKARGGFRRVLGNVYFVLQLLKKAFPFILNGLYCMLGCFPCIKLCAVWHSFKLAFTWHSMIKLQGLCLLCFHKKATVPFKMFYYIHMEE